MNLEEFVAQEIVKGFSNFKPDKIKFIGKKLRIAGKDNISIYEFIRFFRELDKEMIISDENNSYLVDLEEFARFYKKRKKEPAFREYWGEDILFEREISRRFFVSSVPLDSEKNEVYRRIAKTMKGALKVIPYKRKGVELTPLAEIYILEKQHLEDKELVQ